MSKDNPRVHRELVSSSDATTASVKVEYDAVVDTTVTAVRTERCDSSQAEAVCDNLEREARRAITLTIGLDELSDE